MSQRHAIALWLTITANARRIAPNAHTVAPKQLVATTLPATATEAPQCTITATQWVPLDYDRCSDEEWNGSVIRRV